LSVVIQSVTLYSVMAPSCD